MIWHLIRYWITFILPTFYKRIQGKNIDFLKVKGPVIIAMNHPNAFTDPIAISYVSYPLRLRYMARGDAFKPGIIAWLLQQIGIVPIFRKQDGGTEGLKKNDEAYRIVNNLLKKNAKIIVFAEGICVQERRLRPLKKGVSRMVFGAYEALNNDELIVIPVGVNYSQPNKFRSDVFYNIGEPIAVKDFIGQYRENPAKANLAFLQTLQPKMKELITHINDDNYDEVVYQVETLCKKDLIQQQNLDPENLEHDFSVLKQLTAKVNGAVEQNKTLVDEFKVTAGLYFNALKKHRLEDWLINPLQNKNVSYFHLAARFLLIFLGFPIFMVGLLGNYLPLKLTEMVVKKIVKSAEFYSSFFIGFAMVFFLLNYSAWFALLYTFSNGILLPLSACAAFSLCGGFSLYFYTFIQKTISMQRALSDKNVVKALSVKRKNLISLINKF